MEISFFGAAQTVTGSQYLLEVNGSRILMECGFFQGRRQETYERNLHFHFDPASIDAVLLSHAHIDHSGNLPNLIKSGYSGPIYTTSATAHLANIMLIDSGHIQESDAQYVNRKRAQRGEPPIEPIYTLEDAAHVAHYFQAKPYKQPFLVAPGVTATLYDAGHILGSAAILLEIEEHGKRKRLWFSGDIGRRNLPLLRDPVLPKQADFLMMECTYGDKPHEDPLLAEQELEQVVLHTVERQGKVIVPSFAVGRTQELVYALHRMIDSGRVPRIPVYVDSPLAVNVSNIYRAHPECFDQETRQFIQQDPHGAALGFDLLTYIRSVEESKALNHLKGPMVILSASGMAETGRILHHLKNNIGDPRNTILIVSWQAPHTLGRRLADREKKVRIFGEPYIRRAEVATIGGFSSHAGQTFLLEYAKATGDTAQEVILVHGEERQAEALQDKLHAQGMEKVLYPGLGTRIEL